MRLPEAGCRHVPFAAADALDRPPRAFDHLLGAGAHRPPRGGLPLPAAPGCDGPCGTRAAVRSRSRAASRPHRGPPGPRNQVATPVPPAPRRPGPRSAGRPGRSRSRGCGSAGTPLGPRRRPPGAPGCATGCRRAHHPATPRRARPARPRRDGATAPRPPWPRRPAGPAPSRGTGRSIPIRRARRSGTPAPSGPARPRECARRRRGRTSRLGPPSPTRRPARRVGRAGRTRPGPRAARRRTPPCAGLPSVTSSRRPDQSTLIVPPRIPAAPIPARNPDVPRGRGRTNSAATGRW